MFCLVLHSNHKIKTSITSFIETKNKYGEQTFEFEINKTPNKKTADFYFHCATKSIALEYILQYQRVSPTLWPAFSLKSLHTTYLQVETQKGKMEKRLWNGEVILHGQYQQFEKQFPGAITLKTFKEIFKKIVKLLLKLGKINS